MATQTIIVAKDEGLVEPGALSLDVGREVLWICDGNTLKALSLADGPPTLSYRL